MRRHDQGTMKPLLSFTTLRGAKGPCRGSGSGPGRTHAPDQALVAHRHASKALSVELRHAASIKVGVARREPPLAGDEGGEHADRQVRTHDGLAPPKNTIRMSVRPLMALLSAPKPMLMLPARSYLRNRVASSASLRLKPPLGIVAGREEDGLTHLQAELEHQHHYP